MSLHELHPEELIDKAERGALDASERATLDRHLTACAVCRFEVSARGDFRAEDLRNEAAFSDDAIDTIVGASLRGADARRDEISEKLRVESQRPRALAAGRRWGVLLAVAVLLVSAQATARWLGIREPSWLAPTTTTVTTTGSKVQPPTALAIPAPPPVSPPVSPETATTIAPDLTVASNPSPTVRSNSVSSRPAVPSQAATTIPDPTASALFTKANADRVQGKHLVATREYRELLEDYPNAPEADLSRATLGRLLLDDGDAMTALPLFDAYLKTGGALREETMVNRATALERLHRSGEEVDAWQALLDAYPQSMHAERARERLTELGAH